jgi:hypothetical protein
MRVASLRSIHRAVSSHLPRRNSARPSALVGEHLLTELPEVRRITWNGPLENVVALLAIATFATILQAPLPLHLAEASDADAAAGAPGPALLADAAAFAFGDVYRTALVLIVLAWGLAWTLRREGPAVPSHATAPRREPALAGD